MKTFSSLIGAALLVASCGGDPTPDGGDDGGDDDPNTPACAAPPTSVCTGGWQQLGGMLDVDPGNGAYAPDIATSAAGDVVVAWSELGPPYRVHVKRWTGTAWEQLGEALNVDPLQNAQVPRVTFDASGAPVVSWAEDRGYVKRWNGTAWEQLGDALLANDTWQTIVIAIAADHEGNLVAAWEEWDGDTQFDVFAARWDGETWTALGDGPIDVEPERMAVAPSVTIDCDGRPVISWTETDADTGATTFEVGYVKRWNGTSWELVGDGPLLPKGDPFSGGGPLVAGTSGPLSVAFSDLQSTSETEWTSSIHVRSWDGTAWSELPLLGELQSVAPAMLIDGAGTPIVAFRSGFGPEGNANSGVFVSEWDGSSWSSLGADPLNIDMTQHAGAPHIALDADGRLVVAFPEPDSDTGIQHVVVRQCQ